MPGCTAEVCSLNDKSAYFLQKGYVIVGVSPDSVESHKKFEEKKNYGKSYMGLLRTTFIISEDGVIEKVFPKVDTKTHAEQIIKALGV